MASLSAFISQGCAIGGGVLTISSANARGAGPATTYELSLLNSLGEQRGFFFDPNALPVSANGLADGHYDAVVRAEDPDTGLTYLSRPFEFNIVCGPQSSGLMLDFASATDETAAGDDGTATIQANGGIAPLTAELVTLSQSQPAASGQPNTFTGLPPGQYAVRVSDSSTPAQYVEATVIVHAYAEPRTGCQDEYADNYDAAATSGGMDACTYSTRWRSAWQPMAVAVAAIVGQTTAYVAAELRIGFRTGHPLNFLRPLGQPLRLRATVGPDGYAMFRLGPYLRAALGNDDGHGGYRLDINAETVDDLYVGYELRRITGELLEAGYGLNAAVPDTQLGDGVVLTPWRRAPEWPGYTYKTARLTNSSAGRYAGIEEIIDDNLVLPCPSNPLPVAWLNPQGSFSYWVFQGRTQFGDTVGEGQQFQEALTGQQRYSDPGNSYQTFKASSGVFGGDDLLAGLRTLWRSPQAWYQPDPEGEWVPITIPRETRDVGRMGVRRQEVVLNFTTATPEWAQGQ